VTEEEKKRLMAMMMRQEGQRFSQGTDDPYAAQSQFAEAPGLSREEQLKEDLSGLWKKNQLDMGRPAYSYKRRQENQVSPNASGRMMSNPSSAPPANYPTAPGSMAGSTPSAEMAAGTGSGGTVEMSSAAGGPSASSFVLPAAVLAAFAHAGEEAGIGVERQNDEIMQPIYTNLLEKPVKESVRGGKRLWEWLEDLF